MGSLKRMKKVLAGVLAASMVFSLAACGKKKKSEKEKLTETVVYTQEEAESTEIMKIGDAIVHLDDILIYVFQEMYQYSATPDTVKALEVTIRKETLSKIRTNYIIYDVASHNNVEVSDEDKATSMQYADNFMGVFKPLMDLYGVSAEAVYDCFYTQMVVTKFENDIKNQLGQTIQEDVNKQYENVRFFEMYQMVFPYVEVDESGEPVKDDDGNNVVYDDTKKAEIKAKAEAAAKEVKEGAEASAVAEKYEVKGFSTSTIGFDGAYKEPLNGELLALKEGEASKVYDNENCYTFYVITNPDNPDMRDYYAYTIASNYVEDEFEKVENKWLQTIEIDEEGDMIGTAWDDINIPYIADVMQAMDVQAEEELSHKDAATATEKQTEAVTEAATEQ